MPVYPCSCFSTVMSLYLFSYVQLSVVWFSLCPRAVRRPRCAAADNLWAPPLLPFADRRAAAENLSAHRRCHCCCVVILLQFSQTKKQGHQKILRIERNVFWNFRRKYFWPPKAAPRRFRRRRLSFLDWRAPPSTKIDRRTTADTMTSAHGSTMSMSSVCPIVHVSLCMSMFLSVCPSQS